MSAITRNVIAKRNMIFVWLVYLKDVTVERHVQRLSKLIELASLFFCEHKRCG